MADSLGHPQPPEQNRKDPERSNLPSHDRTPPRRTVKRTGIREERKWNGLKDNSSPSRILLSSFHSKTIAAVGAPRFEPEAHISGIPCFQKDGNTCRRINNKMCERDALSQKRSQKQAPTPAIKPDSAIGRQSYKIKTQKTQNHFLPENPKNPKYKF